MDTEEQVAYVRAFMMDGKRVEYLCGTMHVDWRTGLFKSLPPLDGLPYEERRYMAAKQVPLAI